MSQFLSCLEYYRLSTRSSGVDCTRLPDADRDGVSANLRKRASSEIKGITFQTSVARMERSAIRESRDAAPDCAALHPGYGRLRSAQRDCPLANTSDKPASNKNPEGSPHADPASSQRLPLATDPVAD